MYFWNWILKIINMVFDFKKYMFAIQQNGKVFEHWLHYLLDSTENIYVTNVFRFFIKFKDNWVTVDASKDLLYESNQQCLSKSKRDMNYARTILNWDTLQKCSNLEFCTYILGKCSSIL